MKINLFIATIIAGILAFSYFYWQSNHSELFYHSKNEHGSVWVYDSKGIRCMSFLEPPSPVVQSCMSLLKTKTILFNSTQMFLSTLFLNEDPRKILIIGLGGASLPKALNILTPNTKIHIVENNPIIPQIVEKYFEYHFNDTNRVFVQDGVEYIKNSPSNRYDLIMLNAFTDDYIPEGFLTSEFMNNVKRVLTDKGVVAMNTFRSSLKKDLESTLFKETFGEYYNLEKNNSRFMVATKAAGKLPGYDQIAINSNLWMYRMSELGVSHTSLAFLYKGSLK